MGDLPAYWGSSRRSPTEWVLSTPGWKWRGASFKTTILLLAVSTNWGPSHGCASNKWSYYFGSISGPLILETLIEDPLWASIHLGGGGTASGAHCSRYLPQETTLEPEELSKCPRLRLQ